MVSPFSALEISLDPAQRTQCSDGTYLASVVAVAFAVSALFSSIFVVSTAIGGNMAGLGMVFVEVSVAAARAGFEGNDCLAEVEAYSLRLSDSTPGIILASSSDLRVMDARLAALPSVVS